MVAGVVRAWPPQRATRLRLTPDFFLGICFYCLGCEFFPVTSQKAPWWRLVPRARAERGWRRGGRAPHPPRFRSRLAKESFRAVLPKALPATGLLESK